MTNMPIEQKVEIGVSPEELFNEVLLELCSRNKARFHPSLKRWHQAFYEAKSKYPEIMESFGTIIHTNPYIHEITECFNEFAQARHLSRVIPEGDYIVNNPEVMRENYPLNSQVQEAAKYICDRI